MNEDCRKDDRWSARSSINELASGIPPSYLVNREMRQAIRALHAAYCSRTSEAMGSKNANDEARSMHRVVGSLNKMTPMLQVDTKRNMQKLSGVGRPVSNLTSMNWSRPRKPRESEQSLHRTDRESVSSFNHIRNRMTEWMSKVFPKGHRSQSKSSLDTKNFTWPGPPNDRDAPTKSSNHHMMNHHMIRERVHTPSDVKRAISSIPMHMVHPRRYNREWKEIPETMLGENENFGKSKRKKSKTDMEDTGADAETVRTQSIENTAEKKEKGNKKRKSSVRKSLETPTILETETKRKESKSDARELLWRPLRINSLKSSDLKTAPLIAVANAENGNDSGGKQKSKLKESGNPSLKSDSATRQLEVDRDSEATIVPQRTRKEKDRKVASSDARQGELEQPLKLEAGQPTRKGEHTPRKHKAGEKHEERKPSAVPPVGEEPTKEENGPVKQEHKSHRERHRSRSRGRWAEIPHAEHEYVRRTSEVKHFKHNEHESQVRSTSSKRHRRDLSHTSSRRDRASRSRSRGSEYDSYRTSEDENEDENFIDRCSEHCSCGTVRSNRSRSKPFLRHRQHSPDSCTKSQVLNEWKRINAERHRRSQKARSLPSRLCERYGSHDVDECTCDSRSVRHKSACSRDSRRCDCSCDCESIRCSRRHRARRCLRANGELIDALSEVCNELESRLRDQLPDNRKGPRALPDMSAADLAPYLSPDTITLLASEKYASDPRLNDHRYRCDRGYNPRLPPRPPRRQVADAEIESPVCRCPSASKPNIASTNPPANNQCPVFYPVPQPVPVPTVTVQSAPPNQIWYPASTPSTNLIVRPASLPLLNAHQVPSAPAVSGSFMVPNVTTPVMHSSMLFPSFAYCQRL